MIWNNEIGTGYFAASLSVLKNQIVEWLFCAFICSSLLQLTTWFDELKVELSSSEIADCVETAEQLIGQLEQQKEATTDACINTITEGENILDQIRLVSLDHSQKFTLVCC